MPLPIIKNLNYNEVKPIQMSLILADQSIAYLYGILEGVLVKVDDFLFPTDFFILDMKEDVKIHLLLGIPLLETSITLIDVELGELVLRIQEKSVSSKVFEAMNSHNGNPQFYCIYLVKDVVEKVKNPNIIEMEDPPSYLKHVLSGKSPRSSDPIHSPLSSMKKKKPRRVLRKNEETHTWKNLI